MERKQLKQKRLSLGKVKATASSVWRGLGSPQLQNILAIISLSVTIYLTLFIFEYTNEQQKATVEMEFSIVPTGSVEGGREWDVTVHLHNFGPADISMSDCFIDLEQIPSITLVGFEKKDFASMARQPSWRVPPPTPWPSESDDFLVTLEDFERGDNYAIRMVFLVESGLSETLEEKWNTLGLRKVTDPEGGGHYFDKSQVDPVAYSELVNVFIQHISLSGQNVRVKKIFN
jgi:hypothetical protein